MENQLRFNIFGSNFYVIYRHIHILFFQKKKIFLTELFCFAVSQNITYDCPSRDLINLYKYNILLLDLEIQ